MASVRVTNLYDLMDSAYDSEIIKNFSKLKNHVPLIDNNPRRKEKINFTPPEKIRYKERTTAERGFSELKYKFGIRRVMVKGYKKVFAHIMFAVIALATRQIIRYSKKFDALLSQLQN